MAKRSHVLAVVALLGVALPLPAAARSRIGLELSPGVSVPLHRFIDTRGGEGGRFVVDNTVHMALGFSLLLDAFEFRYVLNRVALTREDLVFPRSLYEDAVGLLHAGWDFDRQGEPADFPSHVRVNLDETLDFHALTFGYRFRLVRAEARFQPYVPVALGAGIVTGPILRRALLGFSLNTGLGLGIRLVDVLWLGLEARYHFYLTEHDQAMGFVDFLATRALWNDKVAYMNLLSFSGSLLLRY